VARVALVHYWLVNWRGGERVLKALADLYPEADIFTHVADPELIERELPGRNVYTTFISKLPLAQRWYQKYLPLMPMALEQLDLRNYDLVISSESGPAKGVITSSHATHICYCHSPMRYVWDMYHDYRSHAGWLTRMLMVPMMHRLRLWDQVSAQRVDHYIANSKFVAGRIAKYYRRDAEVIYPPVAVDDFEVSTLDEGFYLSVGQLVGYKRADLLVDAFNQSGKPLVIIGDGELLRSLKKRAASNVRLLGRQSFKSIRQHYSSCRALVFPGVEDFGIVPVEAMASGKPVIAYAVGGALETVVHGETGWLFGEQSVVGINKAVADFEAARDSFDANNIRAHALEFSEQRFKLALSSCVTGKMGSPVDKHMNSFDDDQHMS